MRSQTHINRLSLGLLAIIKKQEVSSAQDYILLCPVWALNPESIGRNFQPLTGIFVLNLEFPFKFQQRGNPLKPGGH